MPSQYEIDTQFMKFLLNISFILAVFSIAFLTALIPTGVQIKFVQNLYVLFLMLLTLLLAVVFGLFIRWYGKYRTSLFKFR
jgi:nitrogen fixation/metabolism regulation signal transduction histidine kinase